MLIRREMPADIDAIRVVTAAAFAVREGPDTTPSEVALVDELRASDAWLPVLSLVAVGSDGDVVGHVLCTRAWVESAPALALAPLSVHPHQQRRGVGLALMCTMLGAADALGEPVVGLVGDPRYFSRFGFLLGDEYGILAPVPEWAPYFQVRALAAFTPSFHGRFAFPRPFDRL